MGQHLYSIPFGLIYKKQLVF